MAELDIRLVVPKDSYELGSPINGIHSLRNQSRDKESGTLFEVIVVMNTNTRSQVTPIRPTHTSLSHIINHSSSVLTTTLLHKLNKLIQNASTLLPRALASVSLQGMNVSDKLT